MNKNINILIVLLAIFINTNAQTKCPCEKGHRITVKGKSGLIDSLGNILIKPKFYAGITFYDTLAIVLIIEEVDEHELDQTTSTNKTHERGFEKKGEKCAVINCKGEYIIKPTNEYVIKSLFKEGYARILRYKEPGIINIKGEIIPPYSSEYAKAYSILYKEELAVKKLRDELNINRNKEQMISISTYDAHSYWYPFSYGNQSKDGYIDKNGNIKIKPIFNQASEFRNGFAIVTIDTIINKRKYELKGMIDTTGNYFIPPIYSEISFFYDGVSVYKLFNFNEQKGFTWGLIDTTGKIIYTTKEEIKCYSYGTIVIKYAWNKFGLYDLHGNEILKPKYGNISRFKDGLAEVELKNGKVGFVNRKGKFVWKPKYQY